MMMQPRSAPLALTDRQRDALIRAHPAWHLIRDRKAVSRYFRCAGFAEAFGFMNAIAIVADKADHHPELSNVYDRVEVVLTTHDVHGLSIRDADMVARIDDLALQFGAACGGRPPGPDDGAAIHR